MKAATIMEGLHLHFRIHNIKSTFTPQLSKQKCRGMHKLCTNSQNISATDVSTEPIWREKLAAANENAQRIREEDLQEQEEYKRQQAILDRENFEVSTDLYALKDLEFIPYLDNEGLIVNASKPDAKASVYAIYNELFELQYVGISRELHTSMKLHFARMPSKCHYVKVQHITQSRRALLEQIKESWIKENDSLPSGNNDNGCQQKLWEKPLDCKLLMTDEEKQKLEDGGLALEAKILKNVARRIEAELDVYYKERNCKESFRFEPKLKEKGLLDLRNKQPDKSVPSSVPKPKSASA